jgi:hypothetical protein
MERSTTVKIAALTATLNAWEAGLMTIVALGDENESQNLNLVSSIKANAQVMTCLLTPTG